DADAPGRSYAAVVAKLAATAGARRVAVIDPPAGVTDGWDAADALAEGWEEGRFTAMLAAAAASKARAKPNLAAHSAAGAPEQHELNQELARFPLTDLGNVRRFVRRHGHQFRFCEAVGWYAWDGRRWAAKGADSAVAKAVHETIHLIQEEAK